MNHDTHSSLAFATAASGRPESSSAPIQDIETCVAHALEAFFNQLEGEQPCNVYDMVIGRTEKTVIQWVMHYSGGNQTRAADILGLNRNTLRKKLLTYGLTDQ